MHEIGRKTPSAKGNFRRLFEIERDFSRFFVASVLNA